jgi:DNA-binding transcriptional regulator YhcF (GntR family)
MEHAGLIVLRQGAGVFVADDVLRTEPRAVQKGRTVVQRAIAALRDLGLDEGANGSWTPRWPSGTRRSRDDSQRDPRA